MKLGSDVLLSSTRLRGLRVGVVANPASIDQEFTHIVDKVAKADGVTLGAIFGPQHGFNADLQDNMIETAHAEDRGRRVPVYSLYSETREPTAEMLAGLDALVIDLQDIGARIYTFVYTMANCLRAAAKHGLKVFVCDRPNPIGGIEVEGAALRSGFESFVGQFPIPMRHGMTVGELARLFNDHFKIGAGLDVIPMKGWERGQYWDQTGLPWVMPSPNVPTVDTAIVYPGTVLVEGTLLSEGRGTTRPFELVGLPGVDPDAFAKRMNALNLDGVYFRPAVFEPTFQKHAKTPCGGCQIHVTERTRFRPVAAGAALLREFRGIAPERFGWRQPPYEYEHEKLPIEILSGSPALHEQVDAQVSLGDIVASWRDDEAAFRRLREPFLLY